MLAVGVVGDSNAALTPAGDVDWYRFEAPRAGVYTVEVFNAATTIDESLYGYDSAGSQIAFKVNGSGNTDARLNMDISLPGTYFIKYTGFGTSSGAYSIRVLPQYDQGLTRDPSSEPNDTRMTAAPGSVGIKGTSSILQRNAVFGTDAADTTTSATP